MVRKKEWKVATCTEENVNVKYKEMDEDGRRSTRKEILKRSEGKKRCTK